MVFSQGFKTGRLETLKLCLSGKSLKNLDFLTPPAGHVSLSVHHLMASRALRRLAVAVEAEGRVASVLPRPISVNAAQHHLAQNGTHPSLTRTLDFLYSLPPWFYGRLFKVDSVGN